MTQGVTTQESSRAYPWPAHGPGDPATWGVALFIGTEAILFSLLFVSYFYIRSLAKFWPPAGIEAPSLTLPLIQTVVLLSSSGTIIWAEQRLKRDDRAGFKLWLTATFVLGWVFLALTFYGWAIEPTHLDENAYTSLLFIIVAFHATHVFVGLVTNGFVQIRTWMGHFSSRRHIAVTNVAAYWHFVDVIWIFVLFIVYISPHLPLLGYK